MDWSKVEPLRAEMEELLQDLFDSFGQMDVGVSGIEIVAGKDVTGKIRNKVSLTLAPWDSISTKDNTVTVKGGEPPELENIGLRFVYKKSGGAISTRRVNGIYFSRTKDGNIILRGTDMDKGEPRSFRTDRITRLIDIGTAHTD